MAARAPNGPVHLRPRSTTALIASRSDTPASGRLSDPGAALAGDAGRRSRVWPVLTWVLLSAAIAALWALLLLGDSLRLSA